MASNAIAQRGNFGLAPSGARALGSRVKPIIRLGMGVKVEGTRKDGSTYTRPDKTDYFTVRGDQRAAGKFTEVYGKQPKAVKIMVPSSLSLALDISYRSFIGGGSEEGGRPLALGHTNFAPLGYVGGPDVLRVWKQDGTYAEIQTEGLDEQGKPLDEIAKDLNIEVYTTFTFTIPDVLGWGSFAAVTSKGKKSADNLAFKLSEIYSAFGAKAPWAFDREDPPLLVLKPDTAMVRFEDKQKGEASWGKSKIFVLDVVIPEPFETMRDRLLERQAQVDGLGGPAAALYGGARELPPGSTVDLPEVVEEYEIVQDSPGLSPADEATVDEPNSSGGAATGEEGETEAGETAKGADGTASSPPLLSDEDEMLALEAADFVPPSGKYGPDREGGPLSLAAIYALPDEEGRKYLRMLMKRLEGPQDYVDAVFAFCRVSMAAEYQQVLAEKALA